jgi:hypothetical protein
MKWLNKINRGAILTGFVLTGVVVYLVVLQAVHAMSIPDLEQRCRDYLVDEVRYSMLPEDQRKDVPDMTDDQLDAFLAQMTRDISAYYPPFGDYDTFAVRPKVADLTAQSKGQGMVYSYSRKIIDFTGFVFEKDTVTVTFRSETSMETMIPGPTGLLEKTKVTMELEDQIIFLRTDGDWAIIYVGITRPDRSGMEIPTFR